MARLGRRNDGSGQITHRKKLRNVKSEVRYFTCQAHAGDNCLKPAELLKARKKEG